ncbi:glycoside hydrolase family 127 protein [Ruminiclostridium papyrosolvens DSM 2782]|uniref:dockerin type I domain-containing protein n=1 Tax=Ruminiclostridium papyrosolvens TaxID=29362 RepID=UPI0001B276C9|nr:dockerin type I domain-containing protein [Ruminiclostridium papyrosolvens]WES35366.1 glycoside hydrolase family 127 protein [Ruminiclostridium papyrosolvens DSM 2782]
MINEIMASQNPETGMENFTKLNDSLYYNNGSDLYVNMYLSSTMNWSENGLSLTQQANVPLSDKVTYTMVKYGDVNTDGTVDTIDLVLLKQFLLG